MNTKKAPVIIIGSGIAGLLTALKLSANGIRSIVATKTILRENSSSLAQGGIAAVLPENPEDSIELHVKDTLDAGAGLSDEAVTRSILSEGNQAIQDLLTLGVPFDRQDGKLAFTKEAAHSTQRILHAGGDATGRSIQDTLIQRVQEDPNIDVYEECIALRLLVLDNRCYGVFAVHYNNPDALEPMLLIGQDTILSTGGIGRLFSQTTNPPIATGDGVTLAYHAGARIQDMEFVQFHPTAFYADGSVRFLISEALRGEGGILRDKNGRAFARDYHPMGELAPRDIVTRIISEQSLKDERPYVTLDITHLPEQTILTRFPNIYQACLKYGVDIRTQQIPVAPAAHYGMGGVWVDTNGETTIENLHAVGEVVSSGLHGANRLASNSLLECVVLARRVAARIQAVSEPIPAHLMMQLEAIDPSLLIYSKSVELPEKIQALREWMWKNAGILRNEADLTDTLSKIDAWEAEALEEGVFQQVPYGVEYRTMLTTSRLICESARQRHESRGAHYRTDYPKPDTIARHSRQQQSPAEPGLTEKELSTDAASVPSR